MRFLVISIFLYVCESWTLTAETEKKLQAFKKRCYRRLLKFSCREHITNEEVHRKIHTKGIIAKSSVVLSVVHLTVTLSVNSDWNGRQE